MAATNDKNQRGGFALGMVVGLLIGLALALGVALYITKVPVPFIDKVPQRTAEQDAAEAEKNRNWDPNAPLASKAGTRVAPPASAAPAASSAPPGVLPPLVLPPAAAAASAPRSERAASAAASGVSARPGVDPFVYFVQVGAFTRQDEAEQLRAKLALSGLMARITEREQSGRIMYRVRLGPYDGREDAERVKEQATEVGHADSALVRVNR